MTKILKALSKNRIFKYNRKKPIIDLQLTIFILLLDKNSRTIRLFKIIRMNNEKKCLLVL